MTIESGDFVVSPDGKTCIKMAPASVSGDLIIPCRTSDGKLAAMSGECISETEQHGLGGIFTDGKRAALRYGAEIGPAMFYVGADYVYRIDENLQIVNSSEGLTAPDIGAVGIGGSVDTVYAGQRNGINQFKLWRLAADLSEIEVEKQDGNTTGAITGCTSISAYQSKVISTRDGMYVIGSSNVRIAGLDLTIQGTMGFPTSVYRHAWRTESEYCVCFDPTYDYGAETGIMLRSHGATWSPGENGCRGLCCDGTHFYSGDSVLLRKFEISVPGVLNQVASASIPAAKDAVWSGSHVLCGTALSGGKIVRKYDTSLNEIATGEGAGTVTGLAVSTTGKVLVVVQSGSGPDCYLYDASLNLLRSARRFGGLPYCCATCLAA